jgi:hypothetical protein
MTEKQNIPDALRRRARERAQNRCEYCLLHEDDAYLPFEVDHIIAEKHGGATLIENLPGHARYAIDTRGPIWRQ